MNRIIGDFIHKVDLTSKLSNDRVLLIDEINVSFTIQKRSDQICSVYFQPIRRKR